MNQLKVWVEIYIWSHVTSFTLMAVSRNGMVCNKALVMSENKRYTIRFDNGACARFD
jgi:hypothetical protein